MSGGLPRAEIERLKVAADLVGLVARRVKLKRSGRSYTGLCPFHEDRNPSFAVYPEIGAYKCFSASCGETGDVLTWLNKAEGLDFAQAVEFLNGGPVQLAPARQKAPPPRGAVRSREDERAKAYAIWKKGRPIEGTITETYLREARGIRTADLSRFRIAHGDDITYWEVVDDTPREVLTGPAMLAAFQAPDSRFTGVHMTWLKPDGSGKAEIVTQDGEILKSKKIRGFYHGIGAIRLGEPADRLATCEGIETGLSVVEVLPDVPVWTAGSWHAMGALPIPPQVRRLTVLGDNDMKDMAKGMAVLRGVCREQAARGTETHLSMAPEGMDHNDWLRSLRSTP